MSPTPIPARHGAHLTLQKSQLLKITNTHGTQTVDLWAFALPLPSTTASSSEPLTYLSMSHTRSTLLKTIPTVDDTLVTNTRRPFLHFLEDTSAGHHDTLFAACDARRYELLGAAPTHRSCAGNLREEAEKAGVPLREGWVPDPLNLFMDVRVEGRGGMRVRGLDGERGQGGYVVLEAVEGCVVVGSACPMDVPSVAVNGGEPKGVVWEVLCDSGGK